MEEEVVEKPRHQFRDRVITANKIVIKVYMAYDARVYLDGYSLNALGQGSKVLGREDQFYEVTRKDLKIYALEYRFDHLQEHCEFEMEILPEDKKHLIYNSHDDSLGTKRSK